MAQGTDAQASSGDDENDRFYPPRTLQLLWGKREFSCYTELLEIPEILHLQSAEPPPPEAIHEVQQVSTNLELLCQRAASDHRYLGLATKDYLKSRMRENCTSGSVRGSRQSLRSKNYVKGVSRLSTRLLDLIASYECGLAAMIKDQSTQLGRKLNNWELSDLFSAFESLPLWKPLILRARTKMASRDMALRDAFHMQLEEYIKPLEAEEYEKFLGVAGDELELLMHENQDVLKRLKERN